MHVDLPSGHSAELRERVTNGQRKRYYEAVENAREVEADVPIAMLGADGKIQRDEHGNVVVATDSDGRTIREHRKIVPVAASMDTLDVFMGLLIDSWTLDLPLPSTAPTNEDGTPRNVLDELDIEDYDALSAAIEPLRQKLQPSFAPTPDEDTPTQPSSE
jgi:hypothetical protein